MLACQLLAWPSAPSMWSRLLLLDTLAGHAGLVALLCAKAFGADAVAITDIKPDNLELAKQLGADAVLHLEAATAPAQVLQALLLALRDCAPSSDPAAHLHTCAWTPERACRTLGAPVRRLPIACAVCCPAAQTSSSTAPALSQHCR